MSRVQGAVPILPLDISSEKGLDTMAPNSIAEEPGGDESLINQAPLQTIVEKSKGHSTLTRDDRSKERGFGSQARSNLRRSFTLPRALFPKKAVGSEDGNFVRHIFLTLVRRKSRLRPGKTIDPTANNIEQKIVHPNNTAFPPGLTPGAVGLKNQGNTCFMNAIVQCLSHTDPLARYLVTDTYKSDLRKKHWIKNGKGEITEELAAILKSTWLRLNVGTLEEASARFKSAVEKGALQYRGSEQHDAQEFLLWLLDRLHEDLNQAASNKYKPVKSNIGRPDEQVAGEAWTNHLRCNNSIIQDIFGAQFRSSLTCPGCSRQSATFDPFLSVSLPIPQAKQEAPVYVNVVYLSQQPRQVKLGLSVSSNADIKELKQLLSADTGIEDNEILLAEIDGEGFHRTFTETQLVSVLSNNEAIYCIGTPQPREVNENDGAFLMITWCNILVTSEETGSTRIRFGSPYISQIARETCFIDLQKLLLKEMASILHPGILISEQKDPVFSIRILDGSSEGFVDPSVEHPLYMESVDHALSLCDEDVPPHIKIHLEWSQKEKDRIIADDSESVEEHMSVTTTRQRHSDETVSTVTLGECFDLYTKAEELSPADTWHCPHCNKKEEGTLKMIGLWSAPQVLVVHLKRFRQAIKNRHSATKISSIVDFPIEGLDLKPHGNRPKSIKPLTNGIANSENQIEPLSQIPNGVPNGQSPASSPMNGCFGLGAWKHRASFKKHFTSAPNFTNSNNRVNGFHHQVGSEIDNVLYDLFAVCNHHGKDLQGGHYTAYCKNPVDGTWWSFDDTRVTELPSTEVKTAAAYILFYHRRNPTGSPPLGSLHWCRNLLKKYHKVPFSNLENQKISIAQQNGDHCEKEDAVKVFKEESSEKLTNGYHSSNESTSSTISKSSSSGSTAPLAKMEDTGIIGLQTEVQIESTV